MYYIHTINTYIYNYVNKLKFYKLRKNNNNIITQMYKDYLTGSVVHFQQIFPLLNLIV